MHATPARPNRSKDFTQVIGKPDQESMHDYKRDTQIHHRAHAAQSRRPLTRNNMWLDWHNNQRDSWVIYLWIKRLQNADGNILS